MTQLNENKNNSNVNNFLKGTLVLTIAGIVVKVIGSLNWIILSRVLGGEGIGLYQMAFPMYLLALSVSSAGIPVAISILTAERLAFKDYKGANRVFKVSLAVLTVSGLVCSVLLYYGAELLIQYRFIRDSRAYYSLIALSPAIFFVTILSSYRGYLQGWQMMRPTAISQIVEQLVRVITMIFFAQMLLPKGLEFASAGASLGAAPGALAGLVVLVYYYWKFRKKLSPQDLSDDTVKQEPVLSIIKRIAKLGLPVSLASIMLPLVANIDLLIVPARLEVAGFAVQEATELFGYLTGMAVPLVNLSTILTASLATSLVPAISEAASLGDNSLLYRRTSAAMRVANLITIPSFIGLWILAEPVSQMIYHAPKAASSISVLSSAIILLGIHQVSTGVLQGMGHTTIPVINMGIAAVIKVILNWYLTALPSLGIQGASWATVFDIGVAAALNLYFLKRYIGFSIEIKEVLKPCVAALAMGFFIYVTYDGITFATHSNNLAAVLSIGVGMITYTVVLFMLGGINERDINQIPGFGIRATKFLRQWGILK